MTDIVDAFVVSLGIDASEYEQEIKKFREDRKRLSTEDESFNRRQQDGQRKTIDGFRKIRNEVGGFLLLLAGANSLKNFVGDMLTGDAATGRFAANIGMATERVSVWENAIKQVGGSAQDAQGAIRALSNIFQEYQLLGDNSKSGDLAFFGLRERDLKNPDEALMKLAERGEGLKGERRAEFTMRLNRLGLNDSMVTLLAKGRQPLEQMLDGIEKAGVATDESAKAAQDLEAEMAKLAQSIQGAVRPAVSDIAEWFTKLTAIIRDDVVPVLSKMASILRPIFGGGDPPRDAANNSRPGYRKVPVGPAWMNMYRDEKIPAAGGGGALSTTDRLLRGMGFQVPSLSGGGGSAPSATGGTTRRGRMTRAERNNNPGNIEDGQFARSQPGYAGSDGRFAKFASADAGFSAMEALLRGRGYAGGGRNTIAKIIAKYAPSSENNVGAYVGAVERATGIDRNAALSAAQIRAVSRAMARHEGYRGGSVNMAAGSTPSARELRRPASAGTPKAAGSTSNSNTTIGTIVIHTAGKDAEAISRDIRAELAKRDLVVQSTSGLKP